MAENVEGIPPRLLVLIATENVACRSLDDCERCPELVRDIGEECGLHPLHILGNALVTVSQQHKVNEHDDGGYRQEKCKQ